MSNVVIIGGGMAGLLSARELLKDKMSCGRITLVEQSDRLGGRVRAAHQVDASRGGGSVIDLGAEFIHGKGTVLTDLIQELFGVVETEEIFVTAHADGGPSEEPTQAGKYGMYYMGGQLMRYDDERIWPLTQALGQMDGMTRDASTSVAEVLGTFNLSAELMELAEASYGNTIGAPHDDISLSVLASFEDYWQQNEIEGDLRLDSKIGMYGVVQRLVEEIATDDRLSIKLNWNVTKVFPENAKVRVYSSTEEHLEADAVIMTVPPPVLSSIDVDLGPAKRQALQYIGMNKAMKVLLLFQEPIWPSNVQSVICGGCPVPEMWFKHGGDSYIATGFITSPKADDFLALCNHDPHQAASIMLQQLSTVFSIPLGEPVESHLQVWDYGYMYPKRNMTMDHLHAMAAPIGNMIFFAGEATNTNACCTVQAAVETGIRAAKQVLRVLQGNEQCPAVTE